MKGRLKLSDAERARGAPSSGVGSRAVVASAKAERQVQVTLRFLTEMLQRASRQLSATETVLSIYKNCELSVLTR